ncbi:MAG: hypothetical protein AAGA48_25060 [Myxococcota bacterium]
MRRVRVERHIDGIADTVRYTVLDDDGLIEGPALAIRTPLANAPLLRRGYAPFAGSP